ncbi:hypothetical protein DIPPA_30676 [Diplonema papillatum]|nr:hypothetical protein DIPPA_30676 [Diplonema papillatum]
MGYNTQNVRYTRDKNVAHVLNEMLLHLLKLHPGDPLAALIHYLEKPEVASYLTKPARSKSKPRKPSSGADEGKANGQQPAAAGHPAEEAAAAQPENRQQRPSPAPSLGTGLVLLREAGCAVAGALLALQSTPSSASQYRPSSHEDYHHHHHHHPPGLHCLHRSRATCSVSVLLSLCAGPRPAGGEHTFIALLHASRPTPSSRLLLQLPGASPRGDQQRQGQSGVPAFEKGAGLAALHAARQTPASRLLLRCQQQQQQPQRGGLAAAAAAAAAASPPQVAGGLVLLHEAKPTESSGALLHAAGKAAGCAKRPSLELLHSAQPTESSRALLHGKRGEAAGRDTAGAASGGGGGPLPSVRRTESLELLHSVQPTESSRALLHGTCAEAAGRDTTAAATGGGPLPSVRRTESLELLHSVQPTESSRALLHGNCAEATGRDPALPSVQRRESLELLHSAQPTESSRALLHGTCGKAAGCDPTAAASRGDPFRRAEHLELLHSAQPTETSAALLRLLTGGVSLPVSGPVHEHAGLLLLRGSATTSAGEACADALLAAARRGATPSTPQRRQQQQQQQEPFGFGGLAALLATAPSASTRGCITALLASVGRVQGKAAAAGVYLLSLGSPACVWAPVLLGLLADAETTRLPVYRTSRPGLDLLATIAGERSDASLFRVLEALRRPPARLSITKLLQAGNGQEYPALSALLAGPPNA